MAGDALAVFDVEEVEPAELVVVTGGNVGAVTEGVATATGAGGAVLL